MKIQKQSLFYDKTWKLKEFDLYFDDEVMSCLDELKEFNVIVLGWYLTMTLLHSLNWTI
jgi:hypothetical protein